MSTMLKWFLKEHERKSITCPASKVLLFKNEVLLLPISIEHQRHPRKKKQRGYQKDNISLVFYTFNDSWYACHDEAVDIYEHETFRGKMLQCFTDLKRYQPSDACIKQFFFSYGQKKKWGVIYLHDEGSSLNSRKLLFLFFFKYSIVNIL